MADITKQLKINTLLARLPLFTPHGWKCIGSTAILTCIAFLVSA